MTAHPDSSPRLVVKIIAGLFVAGVGYLLVSTVVFASGFLLLNLGITAGAPWIGSVQRDLYMGGLRAIWQNQPDCVSFDEELVYRPKEGVCRFRNPGFDTTLTFAGRVRLHAPMPGGRAGVAVIGDSHAMGWGVNDGETFSARLQERIGRPVFNLGVSSYGTARELIALQRSGLLDAVDTVIIQYCDNDLVENREFSIGSAEANRKRFEQILQRKELTWWDRIRFMYSGLRHAQYVPFEALLRPSRPVEMLDFAPHYGPLIKRLAGMPVLAGKRVIVFYVPTREIGFRNYPAGRDRYLPHVEFVDLKIPSNVFYTLDDHMTAAGHRLVAEKLAALLARQ